MKVKALLFIFMFLLIAGIPLGQARELNHEEFEIELKSRHFTPPEKLSLESVVSSTEGRRIHVLMQFYSIPDDSTKKALKNAGIQLLKYLPQKTWFASIPVTLSPDNPALFSTRWIGSILPEDKIAPRIAEEVIGSEKINLVVKYFKDVNAKEIKKRLEELGVTILGEALVTNSITISTEKEKILVLANEDAIRWIEPGPPPARGESYRIRAHVQSSAVQSQLGLSGDGVTVGVFEDSHAYRNHQDFSGRVSKGDSDATNYGWHATNVAGVIGGDGSVIYNYRGMAPEVDIYSYDYSAGATTAEEHDNYIGDLQTAITTHNIDIANNSWGSQGCDEFGYGDYVGLSPTLDGVVRGEFGKPITVVFSAGNERYGYGWDAVLAKPSDQHCILETEPPYLNYGTMNHPKSAKNTIVVGAVDSGNNAMTIYSNWGPTDDGRIKPEIVASGHHYGVDRSGVTEAPDASQMYLAPFYPSWSADYGYFGLTSCAAAATSGSIALLLEDFRNHDPVLDNPLPSTVKALLIHSAFDLSDSTSWYNPGPDYASGYGLLQIYDAIHLKRSGSALQSRVGHGEEKIYFITVPAGASSVKVTLVWDDVPGVENADPTLVNDLNLDVVDDQGVHHHPWVLDPDNPSAAAQRQVGNIESGVDHINNVEQVVVDLDRTDSATVWRAVVRGYNVPEGPQRFSLVANEVKEYAETVWNTMQLETDGGYESSMVLDSENNPHIAHTRSSPPDELKYTWRSNGNWYTEVVTSGHPVFAVSLALDSNGDPHIIYNEDISETTINQTMLTYAHKAGDSWITEQLAGPSQNPINCSLSLDSNDRPHISFSWTGGVGQNQLIYTYNNGNSITQVYDNAPSTHDGGSAIGHFVAADDFIMRDTGKMITGASVDVSDGPDNRRWDGTVEWWILDDNGGAPGTVIASGEGYNITQSALVESPSGFRDFTVDFDFGQVFFIEANKKYWLALHFQSDFSRMSVFWDHTDSYKYTRSYSGGQLVGDSPDFTGQHGGPSSYDKAFRLKSRWFTESPDTETALSAFVALDSFNRPHLIYKVQLDPYQYAVRYARKTGASWITETVNDGLTDASYIIRDFGLNSAGRPRLVYYKFETNTQGSGDLMYAWQDEVGGPWNNEIAVAESELGSGSGGRWSSMSTDSNDSPYIAYYANGTLKYARKIAGLWIKQLVDDNGGRDPSLALDSRDNPHIAYYKLYNKLGYAFVSSASAQSATGEGPVAFFVGAGQLSSVTAISEQSLPAEGKPEGLTFPFGFFSWTVTDLEPGQTVTLTIVHPYDIASPAYYWKVLGGSWTDVTSLIGDDDGDNILTLTITDGGPGDADLSVNGQVSDPGGFAIGAVIKGDFNFDGCVDRSDYYIIIADIRDGEPNDPVHDLNDDGAVNIADARYLATLFTNPRGAACD